MKRYWECINTDNPNKFTIGNIYTTDENGFYCVSDDYFVFSNIKISSLRLANFKEVNISYSNSSPTIYDLDSISLDIMDLACKAYSSAKDESEKEYILSTFLSIREGLSKIEKFITKDNSEED